LRTSLIRSLSLSLGVALAASAAFAGVPVASVTSAQLFYLDGTPVSNPGVNSWPLVITDDLATSDGAAVLNFRDGSRVEMAANSRVQLTGTDASPRVLLLAGKMNYNIAAGSHVSVVALAAQAPETTTTASGAGPAKKKKKGAGDEVPPDVLSKQTQVLRVALPIAFAGLAIATDAILQPGSGTDR
jgi:hypothetical protein